MMKPAQVVDRQIWRHNDLSFGGRSIPEETAVALTYNDGFELFTHPCRILFGAVADPAGRWGFC